MIIMISLYNVFFSRDQRLHKLVFEENGLPDGTEVAYYARGKVVCMCISSTSYRMSIILLTVILRLPEIA